MEVLSDAFRNFNSFSDWVKYRKPSLELLRKSLGEFPDRSKDLHSQLVATSGAPNTNKWFGLPKDLHVRVTGRVQGDGFVIENTVFQGRPGLWITANVYVPASDAPKREGLSKWPGIIISHSHHSSKEHGELQDMGMTWARRGCVVVIPDHLGHGERRQHPFATADDYAGEFRLDRQDYYFRYDAGMHLHLIGDSLLGWMAWDLMRCVDYLALRPDVDSGVLMVGGSERWFTPRSGPGGASTSGRKTNTAIASIRDACAR